MTEGKHLSNSVLDLLFYEQCHIDVTYAMTDPEIMPSIQVNMEMTIAENRLLLVGL